MRIYVGYLFLIVCVIGIYGVDDKQTTESSPDTSSIRSTVTSVPEQTTKSDEVTTVTSKTETTAVPTIPTAATTKTTPAATTETTSAETTPAETTGVPTTLSPPSTTPLPNPETGSWEVTEHNDTCIRAALAAQIKIQISDETIVHNLSPNATSNTSTCEYKVNGTEQILILVDGDFVLSFIFVKDSTQTYVQNISISWSPDVTDMRTKSGKFFTAANEWSYFCTAHQSVTFENATVDLSAVHLQAFGKPGNSGFYKAQECSDDDKMNDIVPIAVALVLVGMVVIILIGYLIGRRQTRQRGYQSM